jgi:P4 family phage/plasmid primase-like protien
VTTATARPKALAVREENIPDALKRLPRWVVWKYVSELDPDTGEVGWDKPPFNARTGGLASSTNPKTWAPWDVAWAAYRRGSWDGVGFVLHRGKGEEGPGLVGLDLDDCRDPQTGEVAGWALGVVEAVASYGEVSPSGTGIRVFLLGELPPHGRKKGDFECYATGRYVTVTGHRVEGLPRTVEHRQEALARIHREVFGDAPKADPWRATAGPNGAGNGLSDEEVIRLASGCPRSGERFRRLWGGDWSDHGSPSEADLALVNHLAYWSGRPPCLDRIDRLMRAGGLYRPKWDRADYAERTFRKATGNRTDYYAPRSPGGGGEGPDDPHRLARLFLAGHAHPEGRTLHWWREEWWRWDGTAYRVVPAKELRAELCRRVKAEFDERREEGRAVRRVTSRLVADVLHALAGEALLSGTVEAPAWLGEEPFPAAEVLACRNRLVHLPTFAASGGGLAPPSPRFFSPNALDYDFDPHAPAPAAWLRFLADVWPDDPEAVGALQEWFGYCLLPDTAQHKILMVVGPRRSGKGTIARVLRALVGLRNTAAPTLAGLGTQFGLQPLLGKTLAVVSDARLSGRSDAAIVVERLLSVSGEDAQTVDRKCMEAVTAKLPVRFVILTNELPRLDDPSGALVGRLVLLRQTRSWYGREDPRLTDRLLGELPGILLWAVAGWERLRERGHFVQPASAADLIGDMEDLSSPVGAFVREECEVGPGYQVEMGFLYRQWRQWCEARGRDPGSEQVFGRDLRTALPHLGTRRPRQGEDRVREYVGIRLAPGEDPFD